MLAVMKQAVLLSEVGNVQLTKKKSISKKAGKLFFMSPAGGRIFLTANIKVNGPL